MKTLAYFSAFFAMTGAVSLSAAILPESQKIDAILATEWQKNNLQPNAPASDEILVRRLYLDLVGRIPTLAEVKEFSQSNDPIKKTKLIDKLLASDGYTSHLFNYWADVLRLTDNVKGKITAEAYAEYVKKRLKENQPYDQFVRDLLTTEGGVWDSGAIGFYQRDENKLDHLAYTSQVFLGTSIVCAQCHNHPFDKWTQFDYYGMAAFTYGMETKGGAVDVIRPKQHLTAARPDKATLKNMSREERQDFMAKRKDDLKTEGLQKKEVQQVREVMKDVMKPLRYTSVAWNDRKLPQLPQDYQYEDGKPGQVIQPKVLFGHEATATGSETRLQAFAKWMTSPENPRFTVVIANRMWKKVFGVGQIEPVDEMTDSTVASNPQLMEYLTQLMIEKNYSIKSFLRVLYNTDTYQRMSTQQELALGETYHFTGPILRRMSAEQVWDSMVTLSKGNVDHVVSEDNERLHEYLEDLQMLLTTVKEKGAEGLIEAAKKGIVERESNQKQLASLREKVASGNAEVEGNLVRQSQQLRRQNTNNLLTAILGEDRAQDFMEGYNPNKNQRPKIDRAALAAMTKEQRKNALKFNNSFSLTARASELPSPAKPGHFLRTFGQSDREMIENANDDATIPQALALLNGPVSEVLNSSLSVLHQDLELAKTPQQKTDTLYLSFLGRYPTNNERVVLNQVFTERGDKAVADISHALLSGSQFLFIQ